MDTGEMSRAFCLFSRKDSGVARLAKAGKKAAEKYALCIDLSERKS